MDPSIGMLDLHWAGALGAMDLCSEVGGTSDRFFVALFLKNCELIFLGYACPYLCSKIFRTKSHKIAYRYSWVATFGHLETRSYSRWSTIYRVSLLCEVGGAPFLNAHWLVNP